MHEHFMQEALHEAKKAFAKQETPIGCVVVYEGRIIAAAHNRRNEKKNPLCHAEMDAIHQACAALGDWRLQGCTLYVTVEPCPMCAGAIIQARIPTVVYGAKNKKAGCAGSVLDILNEKGFNHQANVIDGVLETECAALMSDFFLKLRTDKGSYKMK